MGREKISLVHPLTSYSAKYQDWCGTHLIFQLTCSENEGGGQKGGRNGSILHEEILSHRKCQGPTSLHSCTMVSENLVLHCCKKPSFAVLNSLELQENHWQVTIRKL